MIACLALFCFLFYYISCAERCNWTECPPNISRSFTNIFHFFSSPFTFDFHLISVQYFIGLIVLMYNFYFFFNKAPGILLEHLHHQILTQNLPQSTFSVPFMNAQTFFNILCSNFSGRRVKPKQIKRGVLSHNTYVSCHNVLWMQKAYTAPQKTRAFRKVTIKGY